MPPLGNSNTAPNRSSSWRCCSPRHSMMCIRPIKPAYEAAGAYAERVDDQIFQGNIRQRVYNQISKADLIVADTTGRNVNVLYEVGYAHALRKHVILLTRGSNVVFDPPHHPHIVYARPSGPRCGTC